MSHAEDEVTIRRLMQDWTKAVHDKDLEALTSLYASDILLFDVIPPLFYQGAEKFKEGFGAWFEWHAGPISLETPELNITIGGDIAFSHSLDRVSGHLKNGTDTDYWFRRTVCFRKNNGKWLIVHEHASLPVVMPGGDLESGKIAVLTP